MTNLLDDTAVLIRRASMSRVKSATRPSIIKTGKKMSNKNKRRAGKKKGRDKGVKKKKKRDESATERQTKHDAESMNTHSRLSNRRLSARFSDDRRAFIIDLRCRTEECARPYRSASNERLFVTRSILLSFVRQTGEQ